MSYQNRCRSGKNDIEKYQGGSGIIQYSIKNFQAAIEYMFLSVALYLEVRE